MLFMAAIAMARNVREEAGAETRARKGVEKEGRVML